MSAIDEQQSAEMSDTQIMNSIKIYFPAAKVVSCQGTLNYKLLNVSIIVIQKKYVRKR